MAIYRVPNEPIRLAVQQKGITYNELARRMGFMRSKRRRPGNKPYMAPDTIKVRRWLGVAAQYKWYRGKRYGPYYTVNLDHKKAILICDAAGIDYVDVGC